MLWDRCTRCGEDAEPRPDVIDAKRFRWMQNHPIEAQALFWNYKSRRDRAKALDAMMERG